MIHATKHIPKGRMLLLTESFLLITFFFSQDVIFLLELNNPLMWKLSNGKFNTLLGHCYIERLYHVRYPAFLNRHNFPENNPTVLHCFTVAKGLDTNVPETNHPTKIALLSIPRKASIYKYLEYRGRRQ